MARVGRFRLTARCLHLVFSGTESRCLHQLGCHSISPKLRGHIRLRAYSRKNASFAIFTANRSQRRTSHSSRYFFEESTHRLDNGIQREKVVENLGQQPCPYGSIQDSVPNQCDREVLLHGAPEKTRRGGAAPFVGYCTVCPVSRK